jgi:uncharacterized protein
LLNTGDQISSMKKLGKRLQVRCKALLGLGVLAYSSTCLFLFMRQQQIIINPSAEIRQLPSDAPYRLPYEVVWLPVPNSTTKVHSWWIPAKPVARAQTTPKTLIYFYGRGSNKSYNLPRMEGLWGLGFSILMIDYRGVGASRGEHPSEAGMYADAQAAWNYVTRTRNIPADQVILYGESLGGAVALELAVNHPNASGVILQSTFTSIADMTQQLPWLRWFPVSQMLHQRFESLAKVPALQMPVLFLHGEADAVVPVWMSQRLYEAAPNPKQLLLIPGKGHNSIYQAGPQSYLTAIEQFFNLKPTANTIN